MRRPWPGGGGWRGYTGGEGLSTADGIVTARAVGCAVLCPAQKGVIGPEVGR